MASRRSRMKVLPNLGARSNKDSNKPVTNSTGKNVSQSTREPVTDSSVEPVSSTSSSTAPVLPEKQLPTVEKPPELNPFHEKPNNCTNAVTENENEPPTCKSTVPDVKKTVSPTPDASDNSENKTTKQESSINSGTNLKESGNESTSTAEVTSLPPNAPSRTRARLPKAIPNLGGSRRGVGSSRQAEEEHVPVRRPPPIQRAALLPEPAAKPPPTTQRLLTTPEITAKRPPPVQRVAALQEQTTNVPIVEAPVESHAVPEDDEQLTSVEASKSATPEAGSHPNQPLTAAATKRTNQFAVPSKPKPAASVVTNTTGKPVRAAERRHSFRGADKDEFAPKKKRTMRRDPPPERTKMTMQDLIYWNPTTNPMKYADEADPDEANEVILSPVAADPEPAPAPPEEEEAAEAPADEDDQDNEDDEDAMPMPQVKIGPDGNIIIDEKSLVIETTASKKNVDSGDIVYEKASNTTYSSYRKRPRAKVWSDRETTKFYRVLNSVGADFSMMTTFFPNRSRYELKLKFNREDRFNRELIDKAINDRHHFDISLLEGEDLESDEDVGSEAGSVISSKRGRGGRRQTRKEDQENVDNSKSPSRGRKRGRGRGRGAGKRRPIRRASLYASDGSSEEEDETSTKDDGLPPSPQRTNEEIAERENDALLFDLNDPLNMNSAKPPNPIAQAVTIDNDDDDASSVDIDEGGDEEEAQDEEVQVLLSTPAPTRAGRQPKRPQLFASEDDSQNQAKKRRKQASSTAAPRPSPVVSNNPASILSHLSLSPTTAESRLVFVPTRSPDQLIHVYMLSPVGSSSAPGTPTAVGANTTPTASPLLTRPGVVRSPCATQSGIQSGTQSGSPVCYSVGSSPIIISPVHYPGMRSPQQALRITQKNFVPNLSSAGRRGRGRGRGRPPKTSILAHALSSPPLFTQPAISVRLSSVNQTPLQQPVSSQLPCTTTTPNTNTTGTPAQPAGVTHITVENRTPPVCIAGSAFPVNSLPAAASTSKASASCLASPVSMVHGIVTDKTNLVTNTTPITHTHTIPSVVPTGVAHITVENKTPAVCTTNSGIPMMNCVASNASVTSKSLLSATTSQVSVANSVPITHTPAQASVAPSKMAHISVENRTFPVCTAGSATPVTRSSVAPVAKSPSASFTISQASANGTSLTDKIASVANIVPVTCTLTQPSVGLTNAAHISVENRTPSSFTSGTTTPVNHPSSAASVKSPSQSFSTSQVSGEAVSLTDKNGLVTNPAPVTQPLAQSFVTPTGVNQLMVKSATTPVRTASSATPVNRGSTAVSPMSASVCSSSPVSAGLARLTDKNVVVTNAVPKTQVLKQPSVTPTTVFVVKKTTVPICTTGSATPVNSSVVDRSPSVCSLLSPVSVEGARSCDKNVSPTSSVISIESANSVICIDDSPSSVTRTPTSCSVPSHVITPTLVDSPLAFKRTYTVIASPQKPPGPPTTTAPAAIAVGSSPSASIVRLSSPHQQVNQHGNTQAALNTSSETPAISLQSRLHTPPGGQKMVVSPTKSSPCYSLISVNGTPSKIVWMPSLRSPTTLVTPRSTVGTQSAANIVTAVPTNSPQTSPCTVLAVQKTTVASKTSLASPRPVVYISSTSPNKATTPTLSTPVTNRMPIYTSSISPKTILVGAQPVANIRVPTPVVSPQSPLCKILNVQKTTVASSTSRPPASPLIHVSGASQNIVRTPMSCSPCLTAGIPRTAIGMQPNVKLASTTTMSSPSSTVILSTSLAAGINGATSNIARTPTTCDRVAHVPITSTTTESHPSVYVRLSPETLVPGSPCTTSGSQTPAGICAGVAKFVAVTSATSPRLVIASPVSTSSQNVTSQPKSS